LDECRDLIKKFKEIGCLEGEAIIMYIHGCVEKEMNPEEEPTDTINMLNKKLKRSCKEAFDQNLILVHWVCYNLDIPFNWVPEIAKNRQLEVLSRSESIYLKNKVTDNINYKFDLLIPLYESIVCLKSENFKKFHANQVKEQE
jgi:hypothetical protein